MSRIALQHIVSPYVPRYTCGSARCLASSSEIDSCTSTRSITISSASCFQSSLKRTHRAGEGTNTDQCPRNDLGCFQYPDLPNATTTPPRIGIVIAPRATFHVSHINVIARWQCSGGRHVIEEGVEKLTAIEERERKEVEQEQREAEHRKVPGGKSSIRHCSDRKFVIGKPTLESLWQPPVGSAEATNVANSTFRLPL